MIATLRIVGRDLPGRSFAGLGNVHCGVQRGSDAVDLVPGDADVATFEVPLTVADDDLRGPFVHGRRGARFVYLSWGDVDDAGCFHMFRRAKISVDGLPGDVAAAIRSGGTVTAALGLSDRVGAPRCAGLDPDTISWSVDGKSS